MNIFSQKNILSKTAVFVLLAIITFGGFNYIGLYFETGPELIKNTGLIGEMEGWHYIGPDESMTIEPSQTVRFHSEDGGSSPRIVHVIWKPGRFKHLMLSGEIRTEGVNAGIDGWHRARLVMASYDEDDRWIPVEHTVVALDGDNSWKRYSRVFRVSAAANAVRVIAQLARSSGTMWVRGITLREAVRKPIYSYWRIAYPAWFIFLLWLLLPAIIGCRGIVLKGVSMLIIAVILYGTLTPGLGSFQLADEKQPAVRSVSDQEAQEGFSLTDYMRANNALLKKTFDTNKSGHFFLFALLAVILTYGSGQQWVERLWLSLVIFAGTTEMMQFFVENRTPLLRDWFTDILGLTAGYCIYCFFSRYSRRRSGLVG